MEKLSRAKMEKVKEELLQVQNSRCGVCGLSFNQEGVKVVVDHDHETGMVRGLLCGGCNAAEGKIRRIVRTWGKMSNDIVSDYLGWLSYYLDDNPAERLDKCYIYPTHKTEEERKEAAKVKAKKARAVAKAKKVMKERGL